MDTQALFDAIMSLTPPPTVILLDYSMPIGKTKSAIELLKMLKSKGNKNLICIGFSSIDIFNDVFKMNGADGAILKDRNLNSILMSLEEIVQERRGDKCE